ncbi:MAG TPA: hypothetical protein VHW90_06495 [Stellaceae bacterium]|nr:hypothetical protein [Stellaceae bacterium]
MLFVIGLPGGFVDWCVAVAARCAERASGPIGIIHANTLEEISLDVIKTGATRALVASRHPGYQMRAALTQAAQNFVVAYDDPRVALADLVLHHGFGMEAALQATASSCAAISGYLTAPGALALSSDHDWREPTGAAMAIARHLQLDIGDADVAELIGELAEANPGSSRQQANAWFNALSQAERETVDGTLAPYTGRTEDNQWSPIVWTGDLFFIGDRPTERARGTIDITGRARCLVHGPHIMLPPGSWSVSVALDFSREAVEHEFLVEVWTSHQLASGTLLPQQVGSITITLHFALDELNEHPVSIRLSTVRAAFDGAFAVHEATLIRAHSPEA